MGGQDACDAAIEFERNSRNNPWHFIDKLIRCRDKKSNEIVQCTVVDCGTSALKGDYVVLRDVQGEMKDIAVEEFHEILV
jgi:hypothetical protein